MKTQNAIPKILIATIINLLTIQFTMAGEWVNPSSSPEGMARYRQKSEVKYNSRWTLADWMSQKEKNRMMDLWLGMYAPSPYELYLGAQYQDAIVKVDTPAPPTQTQRITLNSHLGFYALALGVEGFYENNWQEQFTDSGGMIGLRIAGKHVQNTHWIIQYGTRNKKSTSFDLQQQFAGSDMDIYIEKNSGIHWNYRYYLPTTEKSLGQVEGRKWETGLFFDLGIMRIYGNWVSDIQTEKLNNTQIQTDRSGIQTGLKFFF